MFKGNDNKIKSRHYSCQPPTLKIGEKKLVTPNPERLHSCSLILLTQQVSSIKTFFFGGGGLQSLRSLSLLRSSSSFSVSEWLHCVCWCGTYTPSIPSLIPLWRSSPLHLRLSPPPNHLFAFAFHHSQIKKTGLANSEPSASPKLPEPEIRNVDLSVFDECGSTKWDA